MTKEDLEECRNLARQIMPSFRGKKLICAGYIAIRLLMQICVQTSDYSLVLPVEALRKKFNIDKDDLGCGDPDCKNCNPDINNDEKEKSDKINIPLDLLTPAGEA